MIRIQNTTTSYIRIQTRRRPIPQTKTSRGQMDFPAHHRARHLTKQRHRHHAHYPTEPSPGANPLLVFLLLALTTCVITTIVYLSRRHRPTKDSIAPTVKTEAELSDGQPGAPDEEDRKCFSAGALEQGLRRTGACASSVPNSESPPDFEAVVPDSESSSQNHTAKITSFFRGGH